MVEKAKPPHDLELRQAPAGGYSIGFALKEGREIVRATATGPLAEQIAGFIEAVEGKRITAYGVMVDDAWITGKGTAKERSIPYIALTASRIVGPDGLDLPMAEPIVPAVAPASEVQPTMTTPGATGPIATAPGLTPLFPDVPSKCLDKSESGLICGLPKAHSGKHRELAADGRVLAAW